MAKLMRFKVVLTGPYTGKTMILNHHKFVGGVLDMVGTLEQVEGIILYMGRSYRAYLEGTPELQEAQEQWAAHLKESKNGERDTAWQDSETGDPTDRDVQPDGARSTEEAPVNGEGHAPAEEGQAGILPSGNGREDPGVPVAASANGEIKTLDTDLNVEMRKVIVALDPDNDDHWTGQGLPRLAAIEEAMGSTGILRADVEAAAPALWNRDAAHQKALQEVTG